MQLRFSFADFIKVFAASIVLFVAFVLVLAFFPDADRFMSGLHPSLSFLLQYLIQFVILFFPLWIFVVDKYSATKSDFGFRKVSIGTLLKNVAVAYVLYLILSTILVSITSYFGLEVPGYGDQESYVPFFGQDLTGLVLGSITVVLVAPLIEEVFFRGFVYKAFTNTWPTWLGSVLTAALFALIHFQPGSFFALMILGLVLNTLYQRTNSLWTPIIFHALNNAIAFGVDVYLSFHPEALQDLEQITGLIYTYMTL